MDEYFTCEDCGHRFHINRLKKRQTMPGDYCPACSGQERCAACSEMVDANQLSYKHDVRNYICNDCANDYREVMEYIKPAPFYPPKGETKSIAGVTRKAA